MKSVLIANSDFAEAHEQKKTISQEFNVSVIASPKELDDHLDKSDLVLLDLNFTEYSGIDFLMKILKESYLPVLTLTPLDDAKAAIEAMRVGAYNYIVKVGDYHEILNLSIKEAIDRFNEREQMKQTIIDLKNRVNELEGQLGIAGKEDVQTSPPETRPPETAPAKTNIVEEIISRFKRGDINLPSLPQINIRFNEMVNKGTNLQEVANLLKQDVAISSKLISVSNSVYYRGVVENKTLGQAISRLGVNTTKRYVETISNRSLYTTENKKFVELIEKLWEHSLSCAYASQIVSEALKLRLPDDPFTMGLLHDIGKLILLQVVAELELKGQLGEEADRAELFGTLDTYHGKFGSALLKRWEFSSGYVQVALYHDNLEEADPISKDLLVVHFANLLVKSMGYDQGQQAEIDVEKADSTHLLKLNSTMIDEVKDQVKRHMEELKEYFA